MPLVFILCVTTIQRSFRQVTPQAGLSPSSEYFGWIRNTHASHHDHLVFPFGLHTRHRSRTGSMIRDSFLFLLLSMLAIHAAPAQPAVTLITADRDGYLTPRKSISTYKELWVQGSGNVISWVHFSLKGHATRGSRACMLCIHIVSVKRPGVCDIHPLLRPVTTAEHRTNRNALRYGKTPLLTIPLDSADSNQMLFLNVTESANSGRFHGIVIRSRNRLDVSFGSKENTLPPVIICSYDSSAEHSVSWFTASHPPDRQTGKKNDFLVCTSNGILYQRSKTGWDSIQILKARRLPKKASAKRTRTRRAANRK
jgi:hypothetical protein